jgi:Ger(x)C family germination protein
MRMIRKTLLLIILFCATLCGCKTGAEDPENRRIIVALGLDRVPEDQIQVTLRSEVLTPGMQGGMVTSKGSKKEYIIRSSEAKGIVQAMEQLQLVDEQSLFIGQCKTIVFGEELCRDGILQPIETLIRPPVLPPAAFILSAKGTAKQILDVQFESSEGTKLIIRHFLSKQTIPFRMTRLWDFYQAVLDPLKDPVLPLVEPSDNKTIRLLGLTLFKGDRAVGELSMDESLLLAAAGNFLNTGTITIPMGKTKYATFQTLGFSSMIKGYYRGSRPYFRFQIKLNLLLREQSVYPLPFTPGELLQLTRKTKNILKQRFAHLFLKLRSLKTDPLALGDRLRVQQAPHFRINRWEREYQDASFKIDLRLKIVKTGITK